MSDVTVSIHHTESIHYLNITITYTQCDDLSMLTMPLFIHITYAPCIHVQCGFNYALCNYVGDSCRLVIEGSMRGTAIT